MGWDFETDPDVQRELDWVDEFVRTEVEPVDQVIEHAWNVHDPARNALIKPLQDVVRDRGLWACHLGPELGGKGYGQLRLALLNEQLGRSHSAPVVFGCQAPDSGNAEILAHYGTDHLKKTYLEPLVANEIVSCFSMTEPHGGSDPTGFRTTAVLDGDDWVINGEKWFSSHALFADFLIVMAVTEPDAPRHKSMSMFVVPADTPGLERVRDVSVWGHEESVGTHQYLRYTDVRVPAENLLGERGAAFAVAQTRLGGGRIHHAMRTVGLVTTAFELMKRRAVSRTTKGDRLADKQLVQQMIADTWIELEQFRLLVLRTAWRIDRYNDYRKVRADISAVKAAMPKVLLDASSRAIQIHGSLGISTELPFGKWVMESFHMGLADGATEIHKVNLAQALLRGTDPDDGLFPPYIRPTLRAAAHDRFADVLAAADDD
ncbi:MAG: acyl-CoA dehydrogenase family protein [Pseudonocardia sp.]|uniref:acyl-CoA dehydrogenase family protein n=1 Tax=unclassified Pseudonocardia TaxID=2619320 RepID=UPI00086E06AE|nr:MULTISPECIES: acyl-CoA dehydrogenase family protein [unclassified Pseudonocardia]MBN9112315.1 acyl-CoA dehydrogenase family protein [Pseudonocardia sp.]ODV01047.1 MAG: acyl-CoA dehydrogenase [Pseudonocardia sp. SCN 73-27]